MTARAKFILFILLLIIVLIGLFLFGQDLPNDDPNTTGDTIDGLMLGDEVSMEETIETGTTTATYFAEKLREKFTEEIGQPIEGIEPGMLLAAYSTFEPNDFEGVEAIQGIYDVVDEELLFEQTETPEHSAARAISEDGMSTLFLNLTSRLDIQATTTEAVDMLLESFERKSNEE